MVWTHPSPHHTMSLIHMNHAYSHWKCKLTPFWQVEFANHTMEMQINLWKCESPHGKCESNVNHICVIMNCPMSGWIAILWYLASESAIIITVVQHYAGHCCAWTTSTGVEVHIYLTEINKYWWSFRSSGAPDCQCFVQCVWLDWLQMLLVYQKWVTSVISGCRW